MGVSMIDIQRDRMRLPFSVQICMGNGLITMSVVILNTIRNTTRGDVRYPRTPLPPPPPQLC